MGQSQPATPMAAYKSSSSILMNRKSKQKIYRATNPRLYFVRDRIKQGHFHVFWKLENNNHTDYFMKHHISSHHILMRPFYVHTYNIYYIKRQLGCVNFSSDIYNHSPESPCSIFSPL